MSLLKHRKRQSIYYFSDFRPYVIQLKNSLIFIFISNLNYFLIQI